MNKKFIILFSLAAAIILSYFGYSEFEKNRIESARNALLLDAKTKADAAVAKRAQEFKDFIESRKSGAKPFSQDVIGFGGLWNAGKCLRLSKDDMKICYEEYINNKFGEHIFMPDDFRDAMKRAIKGGIQDIRGVENELAVALHQTIDGRSLTPQELPVVEQEFQRIIDELRREAGDGVSQQASGLVVSEIATQVITKLGVSSTILATGGANAWWSLGGTLVIGVAVNAIWNYFTHPDEKIELAVAGQLDTMALTGSTAIRDELTKIVEARSHFWQSSVKGSL